MTLSSSIIMARSQSSSPSRSPSSMPKPITTLVTFLFIICALGTAQASHKSIHLLQNGSYTGIVVALSSDFQTNATDDKVLMVNRIMTKLQSTSQILNELLGVQFGEVTIVLPDGWNVLDQLKNVEAQPHFKPLQEADIIFTDPEQGKEQILTMQYGQCGEAALPINIYKTDLSHTNYERLIAHQWLLYRYGVFNEFGYVNDPTYPVYFLPANGGALNHTSSKINSCSNKPEFNYTNQCPDTSVDPNTGLPNNPNCDIIPVEGTIQSSFLYAPLAVSQYSLCDAKTHDYLSPNKQNMLCDYQSAHEVIAKHSDFETFKPTKTVKPIRFRIWQKPEPTTPKAYVMYIFPSGYSLAKQLLEQIKYVSTTAKLMIHQVKIRWYNTATLDHLVSAEWQDSTTISSGTKTEPINGQVDLIAVLGQIVKAFQSARSSQAGGTCVFVFKGEQLTTDSIGNDLQVDRLVLSLNDANIGLRIIVEETLPPKAVSNFFQVLTGKLTAESSVNYAVVPSSSSSDVIRNQVYSSMSTVIMDTIQDITEQSHILLKRETIRSTDKAGINFTVDASLKNTDYKLMVEVYTTGSADNILLHSYLANSKYDPKPGPYLSNGNLLVFLYNKPNSSQVADDLYVFHVVTSEVNSLMTVSIRVVSESNGFRSYLDHNQKETSIKAKCWLKSDTNSLKQYPLRGYVQVSQGLNGPVYDADVSLIVRRFISGGAYQEFNVGLSDNGRGSPDITARDGIYSAYLDKILSETDAVYSVSARIYSDKIAMKPANFGNTVMYSNKPRCCGSDLRSLSEDIQTNKVFERVVNCGSFFHASGQVVNQANYAIQDLKLVSIDADNRTVVLQWNTPFDQSTSEIKAFHSVTQNTNLPADIKKHFAQQSSAEIEIEPVLEPTIQSAPMIQHYSDQQDLYDIGSFADNYVGTVSTMANSLRKMTVKINSPEEGYYFIAVKERDNGKETKPSNVVPVYMKSNVPIESNTAFAIDDSKLPEGTRRESLSTASLTWYHYLLIGLGGALLLLIIILIIICAISRKRRQVNKQKNSHVDYEVKKSSPVLSETDSKQSDSKPNGYFMHNQDASSLISNSLNERNSNALPNSNVSNNTSCSSVNTVDNQPTGYMTPSHLEPHNRMSVNQGHMPVNMQQQQQMTPNMNMTPQMTPNFNHHHGHHNQNQHQPIVKELNVATLLPNSWDAKELLDHWGRVQEAKQRQESPPVLRMHTASPSIPSFGGSSLDNFNQSYQFQPAQVQQSSMNGQHYGQQHDDDQSEYHQPPLYSPYSNASSIWQHHHQQQQQQQQQQAQRHYGNHHGPMHHMAPPHNYTPTPMGYDDNGLPEYSVVRKVHPNISQV